MSSKKQNQIIKKTSETINVLPDNALKTFIYVGGAFLLWRLYKTFKIKKIDVEPAPIDTTPNSSNTTITENDARIMASQLLAAMDRIGTDENTIYKVFERIQTPDDFLMVYNAFGKKYYDGTGQPWLVWGEERKSDLVEWLKNELSPWMDYKTYNLVKAKVESAGFVF